MIQSPLDAELDPTLDPLFERPPRIANTLPPPQTSPSSDPRMERFSLDEPTPAGVDSGVSVVPPIDQGTYGPPPGVDPTAPPPVYPPNVGEAPSTPVDSAPRSQGGGARPDAPPTASPDPVVEPSTYNTLPAAVPFGGGIISDPVGPDFAPPEQPAAPPPAPPPPTADAPKQPIQPDALPTANPNGAPPIGQEAPPPAPPQQQPTQQPPPDTSAEDERMRRLTETNAQTRPTEVPTAAIDPENSLVGQQVLPNEGARLQRLRSMQDTQLDKVANGPNRFAMAKDRFSQFEKDTAPEYDLNRKKALGDAANFGYTGSGRLNTDYGNLELQRERDMDSQRSRLFNTALDKTVDDDREILSTIGGISGDEADYEKGGRDETRGERGYQRSLSERALADQMDAARMQEDFTQSEFRRDQERTRTGYANDPTEQYEQAARQAAREGEISAEELASILAMIAQQRQQQPAGAEG